MPTDNKPDTSTPPWGDDFSAETAWTLITNLRDEVKGLKTDKTALKASNTELSDKVAEFESAGQTEAERAAAKATADAEALTAMRRELYTERALRKFDIPEELMEFLTGDDEETILAKAERLSTLGKGKADADKAAADQAEADAKAAADALNKRPKPGLTPGHGGDDPEVNDIDKIVGDVRGARL